MKRPPQPDAPTPSLARDTDAWPGGSARFKALVAVARSILLIVWELLADPTTRYHDLGPEFFDNRVRPERRKQNHIRQLELFGYKVTLEPAAA